MLPLVGLFIGIILGFLVIPAEFTFENSSYVAVAILAALDSVFGGIAARVQNKFKLNVFISGFFGNAALAALLAYVGDLLGLQLHLAAIFAFGNRLFLNFAVMRIFWVSKWESKLSKETNEENQVNVSTEEMQILPVLQETEIFAAIDVNTQEQEDVNQNEEQSGI